MSNKMQVSLKRYQEKLQLTSQVATDPGAAPAGAAATMRKQQQSQSQIMLKQLPFAKMPPPSIDPAQHCMATLPWIICYILRQGKIRDKRKYAFQLLCTLTNLQAEEVDESHQFATAHGYNCIQGHKVKCSAELMGKLQDAARNAWHAEAQDMEAQDFNSEKSLPAFLWSLSAIVRTPKRYLDSICTLACQLCNELIALITLQADYWARKQPNASVHEMMAMPDRGPKGRTRKVDWLVIACMNRSKKPHLSAIQQQSTSRFLHQTLRLIHQGNAVYLQRLMEEPHSCRIFYPLAQPLSLLSL